MLRLYGVVKGRKADDRYEVHRVEVRYCCGVV